MVQKEQLYALNSSLVSTKNTLKANKHSVDPIKLCLATLLRQLKMYRTNFRSFTIVVALLAPDFPNRTYPPNLY